MTQEYNTPIPGFNFQSAKNPLKKFTATLRVIERDSIYPEQIHFRFDGAKQVVSTEAFSGTDIDVKVRYSEKSDNSAWGKLGHSAKNVLGFKDLKEFADAGGLGLLLNREQTWETKTTDYGEKDGKKLTSDSWYVTDVAGTAATAGAGKASEAVDAVVALFDGKMETAALCAKALSLPIVKANAKLSKMLTDKKFGDYAVKKGYLVQDQEGAYHKPAGDPDEL